MSTPATPVKLAKRSPNSNSGILPVPASATQKNGAAKPSSHRKGASAASQAQAIRLKLVVRKLPPGLTQAEFETVVGDEWKPGAGKVDWAIYRPGKVSKDPAKPSKPSRAYLHLTHQSHITSLRELVRNSTFTDAKNTTKDAALFGPPSLEFAPFQRLPPTGRGRQRPDNKQGTIDQDDEFKSFLAELTAPIVKPSTENDGISKAGRPLTTPLIEFLREKKVAREKIAAAKAPKHARQDSKDSSDVLSDKSSPMKTRSDQTFSRDNKAASPTKAEPTAKNSPQSPNKDVQSQPPVGTSNATKSSPASQPNTGSPSAAARRDRGNMSGVARMFQRDLGLSPGVGRRGPRRDGNAEPSKSSPLKQEETATHEQEAPATAANPVATEQTGGNTNARPTGREANTRIPGRGNYRPTLSGNQVRAGATQTRSTPGNFPVSPSGSKVLETQSGAAASPTGPRVPPQPPRGPAGRPPVRGRPGNEPHQGSGALRLPAPSASNAGVQPSSPGSSITGPAANQSNPTPSGPANTQSNSSAPPTASSRLPKVSPTATQAFLKHANPSQGITEPLLEEAMRAFGPTTKVEIDQRKGFAYVDFAEPESLQKAVQAGNVKVAQGSVQVLERKERYKPAPHPPAAFGSPGGPPIGPRGGMMGGGGGGYRGGFRGRGGRGGGISGRGGAAVGGGVASGAATAANTTTTTTGVTAAASEAASKPAAATTEPPA